MHVFKNQRVGMARFLQRAQQRRKNPVLRRRLIEQVGDVGTDHLRHVLQGSERARREQRLAAAPAELCARGRLFGERAQQRRFADTRLSGQDNNAAMPGGSAGKRVPKHRQLIFAFNQHGCASARRRRESSRSANFPPRCGAARRRLFPVPPSDCPATR